MLAAARLDQPVDRVVGVVGARLDAAVAEEDSFVNVGVVLDVGEVAGRVVGEAQVLHDAWSAGTP